MAKKSNAQRNNRRQTKDGKSTNTVQNSRRSVKNEEKKQYDKRAHLRAEASDPKKYVNRVMGSTNDFSWYNKNPGIIEDATKISFFNQLGAELGPFANSVGKLRIPGVMTFSTITGPGTSTRATSGASLAGLSCYDAIRRELNKPNPDYEAQDVMMYILACDDIFAQYMDMLRAFGIAHTWSGDNLYTPRALLHAIYGWDEGDFTAFMENEANYRATVNMLLLKVASFMFYPTDFSITDRHAWLFGNVFEDHDSLKSQLYAFTKRNRWFFDELKSQKGTQLIYKKNDSRHTIDTMISEFDESIEALRSSTLVRSLVADMRQAFGDANLLQMGRIDETFAITPTYDENALMQIENMDVNFAISSIEGNNAYKSSLNVTQDIDKNILIWTPFLEESVDRQFIQLATKDKVLNVHKQITDSRVLAEATRLMTPWTEFTWEDDAGVSHQGFIPQIASDCVVNVKYCADPDFGNVKELRTLVRESATLPTLQTWLQEDLAAWSAFDWAPKLFYIDTTATPARFVPILEWDNYTIIGASDNNSVLQRLNIACNLSMWSVPEWGTYKLH